MRIRAHVVHLCGIVPDRWALCAHNQVARHDRAFLFRRNGTHAMIRFISKERRQFADDLQTLARPGWKFDFDYTGSGHIAIFRITERGRWPIHNDLGQPIVMASSPKNPWRSQQNTLQELRQAGAIIDARNIRRAHEYQTLTTPEAALKAVRTGDPDDRRRLLEKIKHDESEMQRLRERIDVLEAMAA